jgi:hypothetical protein
MRKKSIAMTRQGPNADTNGHTVLIEKMKPEPVGIPMRV